MPRYFFHVRRGINTHRDDEGQEFPDTAAAREEALMSARQILADAIKAGRDDAPDAFVIAAADGRELTTVQLSEALPKHWRA